jgi:NADH-quinone oxidoreductase subunit G
MAERKQITLTVEGRPVAVPEGTSILEAAKAVGILIPHYCYHPGLPVAGVCRMCLVEVEKAPKLAPACATAAAEGQVVHVYSEKALEARKGVLEFLLINHPLDCPICDQAGECELQDYTYQEGPAESRYKEPKRFNPVEDFGGDVLYVANRCILCTRCVRFMDDVARESVLNVSERGDRAVIGKFEGADLTHPWSGNVVDLCPVGALLSKDFLNKARAWELDRAASVCPNCTQGCNTIVETRDNTVVRLRPRPNEDVNKYFLCDYGRLTYRWLNEGRRLEAPLVRAGESLAPADWDAALGATAKGTFFVSQAAAPHLRESRGAIVMLEDVAAYQPWPSFSAHCAAKAAQAMLTRVLARALAPDVRVCGVAPGPVAVTAEQERRRADETLLGRVGSPDDVAAAVLFLASDDAAHVTGASLAVDGGYTAG